MHLRHFLLKVTLDIEHYVKVNLIHHMEVNDEEDGYETVREFIESRESENGNTIVEDIKRGSGNPYCGELLYKYGITKGSKTIEALPVWVFVEVISFGKLKDFYRFYYKKYNLKDSMDIGFLLMTVNQLRNAVAHNNCIINNLYPNNPYNNPNYRVTGFLSKAGVNKEMRKHKMKNPRIRQIVTALYVFDSIVTSKAIKNNRYKEFSDLLNNRMKRHKDYYQKNNLIVSNYEFINKISDYLCQNH